jgi:hypothetical protein
MDLLPPILQIEGTGLDVEARRSFRILRAGKGEMGKGSEGNMKKVGRRLDRGGGVGCFGLICMRMGRGIGGCSMQGCRWGRG